MKPRASFNMCPSPSAQRHVPSRVHTSTCGSLVNIQTPTRTPASGQGLRHADRPSHACGQPATRLRVTSTHTRSPRPTEHWALGYTLTHTHVYCRATHTPAPSHPSSPAVTHVDKLTLTHTHTAAHRAPGTYSGHTGRPPEESRGLWGWGCRPCQTSAPPERSWQKPPAWA